MSKLEAVQTIFYKFIFLKISLIFKGRVTILPRIKYYRIDIFLVKSAESGVIIYPNHPTLFVKLQWWFGSFITMPKFA